MNMKLEPTRLFLAHRRSTSLSEFGFLLTFFVDTLGEELGVFVSGVFGGFSASSLECDSVSLVLHSLRSDQSLDLWCFCVWLSTFLLGCNFTSNDEFADIVLLAQAEESSDLGSALRSKSLWVDNVGQTGDVGFTLLDNGECKDREIKSNDAASNRLSLALTGSSRSVAGVAFGEEESDTGRDHNTLLHGKALLVIASSDAEDIALPFITKRIAGHFVTHSLVDKNSQLSFVFNFDHFLRPIGRIGNIELHLV